MAGKAINKFFAPLDNSRVFLVLTHCDKLRPNQDYIVKKLASISENSGLYIPEGNVIQFDKTKESLEPLILKLTPGSTMHLVKNLEEVAHDIRKELPNDFGR